MKIIIINGPNLNLLGKREPGIYGNKSFEEYFAELKNIYKSIQLEYFQSNSEGSIIDKLHETGYSYQGIVMNAGGYTHSSIAIADAVAAIETPLVEVHISNVYNREAYRHHSYISKYAKGVIVGFGLHGYRLAIESFLM
ncbi:MAG: type II 3-dehydroquinate dehydratase [Cytophagaceae bacterium]|nr:type II 3-dehydroquinate dehydratase [Cytophagaceae bacterium]MDW8456526.1 type II 3-dehydroquinate dehydratase [Cytophagaceae bacterium]